MNSPLPLLVLAALVGAGTGWWLYYRRTHTLRRRLSDANSKLEQLQRTFNRFAPARVVNDILESIPSTLPRRGR
jgi:membrane protein YqaA with SNARE-associated domain